MQVKRAKTVHYESGPNMTPLVDVVMVILIFLMLAGSFGSTEHFMTSSTSIRGNGAPRPPVTGPWTPPILLDVQVSRNGDASLLGVMRNESDPDKVTSVLETKLAQYKAAGHPSKDVEVVLHPMSGTKWENLAPLYDAALRAKAEKISFAQAR